MIWHRWNSCTSTSCTRRNHLPILFESTGIRLYLPFYDRLGTEGTIYIYWIYKVIKMMYTIWFWSIADRRSGCYRAWRKIESRRSKVEDRLSYAGLQRLQFQEIACLQFLQKKNTHTHTYILVSLGTIQWGEEPN